MTLSFTFCDGAPPTIHHTIHLSAQGCFLGLDRRQRLTCSCVCASRTLESLQYILSGIFFAARSLVEEGATAYVAFAVLARWLSTNRRSVQWHLQCFETTDEAAVAVPTRSLLRTSANLITVLFPLVIRAADKCTESSMCLHKKDSGDVLSIATCRAHLGYVHATVIPPNHHAQRNILITTHLPTGHKISSVDQCSLLWLQS